MTTCADQITAHADLDTSHADLMTTDNLMRALDAGADEDARLLSVFSLPSCGAKRLTRPGYYRRVHNDDTC